MRTLDYYLSLNSPWSFLGGARLHDIATRYDVHVNVMPIDAAQVFPVSGGLPLPKRAPQRQAYRLLELERWRKHLGIPLILEPEHFPSPEAGAARLVVAAAMAGQDALALATAFGHAIWVDDMDFSAPDVQRSVLASLGLDFDTLNEAAKGPEAGAELERYTLKAIEQQIFGMPSYVYDGELFWGQDRIEFLERAIAA